MRAKAIAKSVSLNFEGRASGPRIEIVSPSHWLQASAAVVRLEEARGRLELNYQVLSALEQFMLQMLRAFARRPQATSAGPRG